MTTDKKKTWISILCFSEAFSLYHEQLVDTDFDIHYSTFCSLHPRNFLLLNDTPKDQSKCKIQENFF